MPTDKKTIYFKIICCALLILIGFVAGIFGMKYYEDAKKSEEAPREIRTGGFEYINPLLECEAVEYKISAPLKPIKNKINAYIDKLKTENKIKDISVYYRNLNNGPWFGINERSVYNPASLVKVPMMVAYLKVAETRPEILDAEVKYEGEYEDNDNLSDPAKSLKSGDIYTIRDLIYRMVAFSDNKALHLSHRYLVDNVDKNLLDKIALEMDVFSTGALNADNRLNIKDYSSVFRILFNASFINNELSESALKLLADSDYDEGLAASLPPDIKIANKYGVYTVGEDDSELQLHDCGIVYTETPYLLCVMTRGDKKNQNDMIMAIREVSRMVYEGLVGL
ncbi:MAG: serine hydrolase [Candidatus Falkowbacteria bacterium]